MSQRISVLAFAFIFSLLMIGAQDNMGIGKVTILNNHLVHHVTDGETTNFIAAVYDTTVDDLYMLNPSARTGIKSGDELKISSVNNFIGYLHHVIKEGDTAYSISELYNISELDLKKANASLNRDDIAIGSKILVPVFGDKTKEPCIQIKYEVKTGETVYSIATAYNTTVENIYKLNPKAKDRVDVGDKLDICYDLVYQTHSIKSGETMYSVARFYNVKIEELKTMNEGLNKDTFHVGKEITLPILAAKTKTNGKSIIDL
ncbi:MAG: LysM peptidoglycan-binding domain-containing protein [Dysgonomonas sp.]|nr:LysM peptidoglycan-binding domain-containing protein [Dysgonomonas sp.]